MPLAKQFMPLAKQQKTEPWARKKSVTLAKMNRSVPQASKKIGEIKKRSMP